MILTRFVSELSERISEPRKLIQVIAGARQVGKTTIIRQFLEMYDKPYIYESADAITGSTQIWLEQIWNSTRIKSKTINSELLLVLDEIQKVQNWSEIVKKMWDEDTRAKININVCLR